MEDKQPDLQKTSLFPCKSFFLLCSCAVAASLFLLPLSSTLYAASGHGAKRAAKTQVIAKAKATPKKEVKQRGDKKADSKHAKAGKFERVEKKAESKKTAKFEKIDKRANRKTARVERMDRWQARTARVEREERRSFRSFRKEERSSSRRDDRTAHQERAHRERAHSSQDAVARILAQHERAERKRQAQNVRKPAPRRIAMARSVQIAGDGPFTKRRATLSKDTRLANTLQAYLGVEVQEDPSHSGGLFIAPPATGTNHARRALDLLSNLPLGLPIDPELTSISSGFGGRQDPFKRRGAFHEGLDFRAKTGTPVQATGKGTVVSAGYSPSYGENIIVSHGNGYETMFAHLSRRLVRAGDEVSPGDVIGLVGSTGRSTGAHLHYEIRHQGAPINPMDYVQATQQAKLQHR